MAILGRQVADSHQGVATEHLRPPPHLAARPGDATSADDAYSASAA